MHTKKCCQTKKSLIVVCADVDHSVSVIMYMCTVYIMCTCTYMYVHVHVQVFKLSHMIYLLHAIDGFAQSIDCTAPSMDPLIARLSVITQPLIDCATKISRLCTAEFV